MNSKIQDQYFLQPEKPVANFIRKLATILNNPSHKQSVIWKSDGKGFVILENNKFASKILPIYYRHKNLSSFVRQLNMYGFHKVKEDGNSYYWHPEFRKDEPGEYHRICRKPEKKVELLRQNKDDKQNDEQSQLPKLRTSKKVSFFDEWNEGVQPSQVKCQLFSNFTIKYNENEQSQLIKMDVYAPLPSYDYAEGNRNASIHEITEEQERGKAMIQSSHKIIFWKEQQEEEIILNRPSEDNIPPQSNQ